ncbi:dihydrofolate reductase [Paenibacillus sp. OAS669]|uniref:dihydrofolate reductase n=1 Tax=Paenibacillus sp. OAS669 TaxID=2663821 RepID=UPI0019DB1ACB|nr:dihydrofolate reductase [Paenibacillus sp. OAS669]MBE1441432.1 dihydrofolate reductase/dihydrofolate reductase (trimethoprim resistance protein) [Paenibacillus sp. OAS669]
MIVSLIAAMAKNRVIGRDADIPWHIPGEQKRFKELTMGKTMIMGRLTYESIGKPLPGRNTIVISKSKHIELDRCTTVSSLQDALGLVRDQDEVFVVGGGQIYAEAMPLADTIYLTVLDEEVPGNIYFPPFDPDDFIVTYEQHVDASIPYTNYTLVRKKTV